MVARIVGYYKSPQRCGGF